MSAGRELTRGQVIEGRSAIFTSRVGIGTRVGGIRKHVGMTSQFTQRNPVSGLARARPEAEQRRPQLSRSMTAKELRRWYWLKQELTDFARVLGLRTAGSKVVLADRIAAHLDERAFNDPTIGNSPGRDQLRAPLTADTVIPKGQRCSQVIRRWFEQQAGAPFRFDAEMRAYFARTNGAQTLHDALRHWYRTRDQGERQIQAQFEYNRFTRAWYLEHRSGTSRERLAAWRQYRGAPVDERGRI